jgi:Sec-independent protein translocase protein TatA
MLSVTEIAILGVGALLLFGPERLPSVMRQAGRVLRDVQNTSQSFIREMEHAADEYEPRASAQKAPEAPAADAPERRSP